VFDRFARSWISEISAVRVAPLAPNGLRIAALKRAYSRYLGNWTRSLLRTALFLRLRGFIRKCAITSIKFLSRDHRHEPFHNSPDAGKGSENRRENNAVLIQTHARHSVISDRIDDPAKRVANVRKKGVDEGTGNHHNRLFKIDSGLYCGRAS